MVNVNRARIILVTLCFVPRYIIACNVIRGVDFVTADIIPATCVDDAVATATDNVALYGASFDMDSICAIGGGWLAT